MDWFTLLLIFIFFVLPLIQQIAESRRRSRLPPDVPEEQEWEFEEERMGARDQSGERGTQRESIGAEASDGWSSGWGSWPGDIVEMEPEEEIGFEPAPPPPPAPAPAPARQPARVTIEPLARGDRPAPEQRGERAAPRQREERILFERPAPVEPVVIERLSRVPRPARTRELSKAVQGARRDATALGLAVHDRRELRQAILLAEVLGPPRALKSLESDG